MSVRPCVSTEMYDQAASRLQKRKARVRRIAVLKSVQNTSCLKDALDFNTHSSYAMQHTLNIDAEVFMLIAASNVDWNLVCFNTLMAEFGSPQVPAG